MAKRFHQPSFVRFGLMALIAFLPSLAWLGFFPMTAEAQTTPASVRQVCLSTTTTITTPLVPAETIKAGTQLNGDFSCAPGFRATSKISNDSFCVYWDETKRQIAAISIKKGATTPVKTQADCDAYKNDKISSPLLLNLSNFQPAPPNPYADPKVAFCFKSGTVIPTKASDSACEKNAIGQIENHKTTDFLVNGNFYGVCVEDRPAPSLPSASKPLLVTPPIAPSGMNPVPTCTPQATVNYVLVKKDTFSALIPAPTTTTPQRILPKPIARNTIARPIQTSGDCAGLVKSGVLCLPPNPFLGGKLSLASSSSLVQVADIIIRFLLWASGIVATIMMILGGYQVVTARGNIEQARSGRKTLLNATIGLAIILFSYTIINGITQLIIKGLK